MEIYDIYYTNQQETKYCMGYLSDWACDWIIGRGSIGCAAPWLRSMVDQYPLVMSK